jgi:predicted N-formylglutamate amidohydrolase
VQREHSEAVRIIGEDRIGVSPFLIVCDHASSALPPEYGSLGLPASEFARHIAWDPGAAPLSEALAARLDAPAVLSTFSRLLIDPNRGTDDPTLVMRLSDGTIVPGNRAVTQSDVAERIARFHDPYHRGIEGAIEAALARGFAPALLSIHTFTPVWRGEPRPWHAAILWDRDDRLAHPLINGLREDPGLVVGDNEPYTGWLQNDCMHRHGTSRGLAHVLIEVRNDLLVTAEGVTQWCDRIAGILEEAMSDSAFRLTLGQVKMYGSRVDGG